MSEKDDSHQGILRTESWTFIMGVLFMAALLGFRSGLIGILRTKLRLTI